MWPKHLLKQVFELAGTLHANQIPSHVSINPVFCGLSVTLCRNAEIRSGMRSRGLLWPSISFCVLIHHIGDMWGKCKYLWYVCFWLALTHCGLLHCKCESRDLHPKPSAMCAHKLQSLLYVLRHHQFPVTRVTWCPCDTKSHAFYQLPVNSLSRVLIYFCRTIYSL